MAHGWFFLLLSLGVCGLSSSVPRQFHVVKEGKTWAAAQQYCRENFTDLATIDNMAEMEEIKREMQDAGVGAGGMGWIGLKYGGSPKWQWSLADEGFYGENEFRNWNTGRGQPEGRPGEDCGNIHKENGKWHDAHCTARINFICYNGHNSTHPYVLVEEEKTWRDAQRYCREKHTDLASVRNQAENDKIYSDIVSGLAEKSYPWIGLFRDAWEWSDGSNSSFRHWAPEEPNFGDTKNEFSAQMTSSGLWIDAGEQHEANFICYEALPTVEVVSPQSPFYSGDVVTLSCDIPRYTGQQQYVWLKDNSPVPGETSQTITITLPLEAGRYQCHRRRDGSSVAPYISTPVAIENQDKLFLVKEQKTWKEALEYCREHHEDLVSVTSEKIQRWVEGWAKGASTPYVWLGLRYSCNLGFWFWVSGEIIWDYDNWASDQEKDRGCTHKVGAVTREGGKWVSFEENAKHNFICTKEDNYKRIPNATVVVVSSPPFYSGDEVTLRCDISEYSDWHRYSWLKDNSPVPGKTSQTITITLPLEAGQYQCSGQRNGPSMTSSISSSVDVISNARVKRTQMVRVEMEASDDVDMEDPDVQKAFLKQIGERLKAKGFKGDVKLSWQKQPDGKVFHKKNDKKKEKREEF